MSGNPAAVRVLPKIRMRLGCTPAVTSGCMALLSAASLPVSSTDLRAHCSSCSRRRRGPCPAGTDAAPAAPSP
eukprot:15680289-Heterocapsa_arctica.AAC.1